MKITSNKEQIDFSSKKVFDFISDLRHFESLLPSDKIENFTCTKETCSFRIKGMADLSLTVDELIEGKLVKLISGGKPFPFSMMVHIAETGQDSSEVYIDFDGEINSFMKMMVEKPLTNFFNMLVTSLKNLDLEKFL